jgi:hypothetical protein
MSIVFTLLFLFCPFAALLFLVRILCAAFSWKISEQMRRHPVVHIIWACPAFVGALVFVGALNQSAWPPAFLERRTQRHQVLERVESAGGWAALTRDCDNLANTFRDDTKGFIWSRHDTNSLPPAISALKPSAVQFYPRKVMQQSRGAGQEWSGSNVVVRISIFGAHSTGGHHQPAVGLDVVCEPGITNYCPQRLRSSTPLRYWRYRRIVDHVYEFY